MGGRGFRRQVSCAAYVIYDTLNLSDRMRSGALIGYDAEPGVQPDAPKPKSIQGCGCTGAPVNFAFGNITGKKALKKTTILTACTFLGCFPSDGK